MNSDLIIRLHSAIEKLKQSSCFKLPSLSIINNVERFYNSIACKPTVISITPFGVVNLVWFDYEHYKVDTILSYFNEFGGCELNFINDRLELSFY